MANLDELRRVLLEMASPNTLRDGVVTLLDDVRGLVASRERHRDTQVVHHARIDQLANVSSESCQRIDNLAALSTDVCLRLVDTRGEQSLHRMALDEHGERLTTLAAQLAGLQRLVEALVNERGEGRQVEDDRDRILDEVLAERDFRCEQIDAIADALGDEGEWSNLHDRGVAALLIADGIVPEVGRLRAEVERLTRERDEAIREGNYALQCTDERVEAAQMRMVEAVAQYLEQRATEALASNRRGDVSAINAWNAEHRAAGLTNAVDALRSGTWKEQP